MKSAVSIHVIREISIYSVERLIKNDYTVVCVHIIMSCISQAAAEPICVQSQLIYYNAQRGLYTI